MGGCSTVASNLALLDVFNLAPADCLAARFAGDFESMSAIRALNGAVGAEGPWGIVADFNAVGAVFKHDAHAGSGLVGGVRKVLA